MKVCPNGAIVPLIEAEDEDIERNALFFDKGPGYWPYQLADERKTYRGKPKTEQQDIFEREEGVNIMSNKNGKVDNIFTEIRELLETIEINDHPTTRLNTRELFKPLGRVTGIGSLPHSNPKAAVEFVQALSPEIPFWPQLPRRSKQEGMIDQMLGPLVERLQLQQRRQSYGYRLEPGQISDLIDYFEHSRAALQPEHAAGFFAFKTALDAGKFDGAAALKGHVTGPITLLFQLFEDQRLLIHHHELIEAVAQYVIRLALWQMARLERLKIPILMFVDEPCLGLFHPHLQSEVAKCLLDSLRSVLATIRSAGAITGLHCCARPPFAAVRHVQPDIFSFDAHQDLEMFFADSDARHFWADGGMVAFGLIPTWLNLERVSAEALFYRWLMAAEDTVDLSELARRSLITATCGLGLLNETAAKDSFNLACHTGELVHRVIYSSAEHR
jgi:methionine synthase II (cobalamin-independent)